MKIAMIAAINHPISRPFHGGLEAHTWQVAKELISRGHDVTIYASGDSDPELPIVSIVPTALFKNKNYQAADGKTIKAKFYRHIRNIASNRAYARAIAHIRNGGFDVVHNNAIAQKPLVDARKCGIPFVTVLHTVMFREMYKGVARAVTYSNCRFIAISQFISGIWSKLTPSVVVHNGIHTADWAFSDASIPNTAIWFGRITRVKAPHIAIRAAIQAGVALDIYGGIDDQAYFDAQIAPLLADSRVRYHGLLDHAALSQKIGAASVMLHTPMIDEPFGYIFVESLACGTPVVGFAAGAAPEIVDEKTGVLVSKGDDDAAVQALARGIVAASLLSRPDCRARAQVFQTSAMIEGYEKVYRDAINSL